MWRADGALEDSLRTALQRLKSKFRPRPGSRPEEGPPRLSGSKRPLRRRERKPPDPHPTRGVERLPAAKLPADRRQTGWGREQLRACWQPKPVRLRAWILLRPPPPARDGLRPRLLDLSRRRGGGRRRRDRGRFQRKRLHDRRYRLHGLSHHRGGIRCDPQSSGAPIGDTHFSITYVQSSLGLERASSGNRP
jgi:hypothetical protein